MRSFSVPHTSVWALFWRPGRRFHRPGIGVEEDLPKPFVSNVASSRKTAFGRFRLMTIPRLLDPAGADPRQTVGVLIPHINEERLLEYA